MLNNCSVPENNVLKCSGICRAVPWNNDNPLYDLNCHVYSTDVDHSLINEEIKKVKPEKVTFIQGDRNKVEDVFSS